MTEVLIGRGKVARVYKIDGRPHDLARKEFSPIYPVILWNWFFYNSPHPLTTEAGYKYAYWKRRLAHRLCKCSDCNVHIHDTFQRSRNGFTSGYIDGRPPKRNDKRTLYATTRRLEKFFDYIGMPTWSFSRRNPFSNSNFLIQDNTVYIIDYEQSVPVPDSRGYISYDIIYFDDVHDFISDNRQKILDKLGMEEAKNLDEAFELAKKCHAQLDIRPKKITKFVNICRK